MKANLPAISRVPTVLAAMTVVMVMAGCTQAAMTSKDLSFGTEGLMVAVVPTLTAGTPMADVTLPEAKGGSDDIAYSVTPMVPGLAFDPATRVLGGTPTTPGTFRVTYAARAAGGDEATLNFTVAVRSSFIGTWQSTNEWEDDDVLVGTFTDTLTFTKSRYILVRSHYRTDSMSVDEEWAQSGTWEPENGTITRVRQDHDHDDDGETPEVVTSVRKRYVWSEDRTTLCVQPWDDDHENLDSGECHRYQKAESLQLPGLYGVWKGASEHPNSPRAMGGTLYRDYTITIDGSNSSFTFNLITSGGWNEVFEFKGTFAYDPEELMILVTVENVIRIEEGNPDDMSHWNGQVLRLRYAPTDDPQRRIRMSPHWSEHDYNRDDAMHTEGGNPNQLYGNYWVTLTRMTN